MLEKLPMRFGKESCTARWKSAWDKLGGTLVPLAIFAQLSVYEIKALSKAVGRYRRRPKAGLKQRKQQIVQPVQGLTPSLILCAGGTGSPQKLLRSITNY